MKKGNKKVDFTKLATGIVAANAAGAASMLAVSQLQKMEALADKPLVITGILEVAGAAGLYFGGEKHEAIKAASYAALGVAGYRLGYKIEEMIVVGEETSTTVQGTLNAAGVKKLSALKRMAANSRAVNTHRNAAPTAPVSFRENAGRGPQMKPRIMRDRRSKMFYCEN